MYVSGKIMAKYQDIYNTLLSQIENKTYPAGELLPGEHELMKRYDASRDTVRKSLSLLAQNGYIQKSQGKGSVVLNVHQFEFPVGGVVSFKELAPTLGKHVHTKVVMLEKMHPDEKMQKNLQLQPDEYMWVLQRVRVVDGEGVILDTDFLNAQIIPELTKKVCEKSLYAYLEDQLHLPISYAEKEISCTMATNEDKMLLDMKNFDMIVNVESYTYLDDSRVFQYTSSRHRPDKFLFKDFARRIHRI
jgi:GntR family trehalose operon transcriptional repressor